MSQINQENENIMNQKTQMDEALDGLIHAIHESPEYKRYQDIRAKVHELNRKSMPSAKKITRHRTLQMNGICMSAWTA